MLRSLKNIGIPFGSPGYSNFENLKINTVSKEKLNEAANS
ncbi:hypothetical protein HMPREF0388_0024 [Mobiluncus curtisii ATCC 51333]|uniref:Uncharacterized protein n=1 Tax=Mobiluncus curtisii ATCC 51333 TaxID=887326 RepID=E6LVY7_9ACTO|nr:hypothetical protein HMPREF0388_0024 [Mobiluncus curtisii ATCC 51333]